MKRNLLFVAAVGAALLWASGCAKKATDQGAVGGPSAIRSETAPAGMAQTTCPVMGSKGDASSLDGDAEGKRIYVCCRDCIQAVKADPAKYIAKLEAEGIKLAVAPKADSE